MFAKNSNLSLETKTAAVSFFFIRSQLKSVILLLTISIFTVFSFVGVSQSGVGLNINLVKSLQLTITLIFFIIFAISILNTSSSRNSFSIELINFIIFCSTASSLLIMSCDLITTFLSLEVLAIAILYSFFVFGGYNANNSAQASIKVTISCIYQFILNFFGSLFFYVALTRLILNNGSTSLGTVLTKMASDTTLISQTIIVLALFIKLGTGP